MNEKTDVSSSKRILSIDFFRVVANFAVVIAHTAPFRNGPGNTAIIDFICYQMARFAVPFFFVISGYFWSLKSMKIGIDAVTLKHVKRLLFLFVSWNIFYALLILVLPNMFPDWFGAFGKMLLSDLKGKFSYPLGFIFEGAVVHLWYLPSLISALLVGWILIKFGLQKWFLPIAFALYIIGILGGSYAGTPVGISLHFFTRNGPFFSTLFVAVGWWLASKKSETIPMRLGIYTVMVGLVIHFTEVYYLLKVFNIPPIYNYVFGTAIYGIGIGLIAIVSKAHGFVAFIAKLGPYTLGIYVIHFAFVLLLKPIGKHAAYIPWQILYPLLVFSLSLGAVYLISKSALIRRFVI